MEKSSKIFHQAERRGKPKIGPFKKEETDCILFSRVIFSSDLFLGLHIFYRNTGYNKNKTFWTPPGPQNDQNFNTDTSLEPTHPRSGERGHLPSPTILQNRNLNITLAEL